MNKIVKTVGLLTMLSSVPALYSTAMHNQANITSQTVAALPKSNEDNSKLWFALAGLGIIGTAAIALKKTNDYKNIPYSRAHNIVDNSFNLAANCKKYSKEERFLILQENEFQLEKLLLKTKNYDKTAAAQCLFTFGAIRHYVKKGQAPQKNLAVKTKYLFDKAVSPKRYFSKLKKQYFEENPDVNFNLNYGKITEVRTGYFVQKDIPLLYGGLKKEVMLKELNLIEKDVNDEENSLLFYPYDKIELLNKIMYAKKILQGNKIPPNNLISQINDLYYSKSLKKTIEIT